MSANMVALAYLVASVFFILALKGLSSPESARRGNLFGMVGMAIAVATTLTLTRSGRYYWRACCTACADDSNAGTGCVYALIGWFSRRVYCDCSG